VALALFALWRALPSRPPVVAPAAPLALETESEPTA
jgi:hypothetical protein